MTAYTGIGSRKTPATVLDDMRRLASELATQGWTLRSGGADGADSAFEQGALAARGPVEIYLPWKGFNNNSSTRHTVTRAALDLAATLHPAWQRLEQGPKKLHARNCYQVLGAQLDKPSSFLVCWTEDGCESRAQRGSRTGGTATAIVLAQDNGIPVFNLRSEESRRRLEAFLAGRLKEAGDGEPSALLSAQDELF